MRYDEDFHTGKSPKGDSMFNRVAFVTGASRGIGRAIALTLCRAGFDIVVASPEIEKNEEVAEEIRACSGDAVTLNLDVTSQESIKTGFARILQDKGRVDVLVNNAGITRDGLAVRMKQPDWDLVMKINLEGAFLCAQAALPGMMRNRWGRIINIASVVGQAGSAGQANYAASKAGLIGLTKALAQEMATRSITVNAVAPGYIATDMTKVLPEEVKAKILAAVPLGRMGKPEDVAAAVKFLASEDASYITGQVIAVNGGMYM
jgi:3-oxoacyl-[acyl-carrier protein] reductase